MVSTFYKGHARGALTMSALITCVIVSCVSFLYLRKGNRMLRVAKNSVAQTENSLQNDNRNRAERTAPEYLRYLTDTCCFHGHEACCGNISCWNFQNHSINRACFDRFESHNGKTYRKGLGKQEKDAQNAASFSAVLDFGCDHKYALGFYYGLFECFLKSLPLVFPALQRKLPSIAIITPSNLAIHMDPLCHLIVGEGVKVTFFIIGEMTKAKHSTCVSSHTSSSRLFIPHGYESWHIYNRSADYIGSPIGLVKKKFFASLVRQAYNCSCPPRCSKIVVLIRNHQGQMRGFIDQSDLLSAMRDHFGSDHIVTFYGNESLPAVARLFSTACAVVGYHGAGFINMLYTCPATLQLEITTFKANMSDGHVRTVGWEPWRSNEKVIIGMDAVWEPKFIEYHHIWPAAALPNNADRTLKEANIMLTREHIDDMIRRIDHYLAARRQPHAISRGGANPASPRRLVSKSFRLPNVYLVNGQKASSKKGS